MTFLLGPVINSYPTFPLFTTPLPESARRDAPADTHRSPNSSLREPASTWPPRPHRRRLRQHCTRRPWSTQGELDDGTGPSKQRGPKVVTVIIIALLHIEFC